MKRILLALLLLCAGLGEVALGASLLPNGKQQFFSANGNPLSAGKVYFYVPGTTTPKDTYQDPAGTILNTNPVQLDAGGFAVIYGSGSYRQVVKDGNGNTIYDQLTGDTSASSSSWAGTATGSPNALAILAPAFTGQNGQIVIWRNQFTNTGATTLTINGTTYAVVKDSTSGVVPLIGGELIAGGIGSAILDTVLGQMHLLEKVNVSPVVTTASAGTVDLGTLSSHNVRITGTTTIAGFGGTASLNDPIYKLSFASAITLTNGATLASPTGKNIKINAGGSATVQYLGTTNWRVLDFFSPISEPTTRIYGAGPVTGTYTVPSGVTRLYVRMIGGAGGGGGTGGAGSTDGGDGGTTAFAGIGAEGGKGGLKTSNAFGAPGGAGGSGGAGTATLRFPGGNGGAGASNAAGEVYLGGYGCVSPFGGAGVPTPFNTPSYTTGKTNTGSGGAGATGTSPTYGGAGGGGCGEYVELSINPLTTDFAYTVGGGGAGGALGAGGSTGGDGASGTIIIQEFYE